jgi:hypothetical protein
MDGWIDLACEIPDSSLATECVAGDLYSPILLAEADDVKKRVAR